MRKWIAAVAAVLLIGAGGYLGLNLMQRFQEMDRRVAAMAEQVERSARAARSAAEEAGRSSAAAVQARTEKLSAETAREKALQEKTEALEGRTKAEATAVEATREAQVARAEADRIRKQRDEELNQLQQALDRIVATRRTAVGLVMNLPESALRFDFDSATLRPESRELLSRIAGVLLASGSFGLAVHGHTDNVGSEQYNLRLSEQRAEAVKQYMASAGIDANIISIKGYGKSSPLVAASDEASRAKNRRVEIALTDTKIKYGGEAASN
jgi:outer membrane protein OmpA-like peptidoglycan-associated protein